MRPVHAAAAILVALLAGSASAQDPTTKAGPPAGSKVDPALQKRVNEAIAKGVGAVRGFQRKSGSFEGRYPGQDLGPSALALYTLRACGVPFEDPAVAKGFARLRAEYVARRDAGELENYAVSLVVLALEAHYEPPAPPPADEDRYGRSARPAPVVPEPDLSWLRELTAWIVAAQQSSGGFGYHSPARGHHDHSNTQYSLLALAAAGRCGVPVPVRTWQRALDHLLQCQETKGPEVLRKERFEGGGDAYGTVTRAVGRDRARGWGYFDATDATGSMTSGGVSSLALCRAELRRRNRINERDDAAAERGVRDGIAWLGLHFTVTENPGPRGAPMHREAWQYYYLYGLERAGILGGVALMGEHDWYREGAEYLVGVQGEDGSFEGALLESCWALLFLKRATAGLNRAVATGAEELDLAGGRDLAAADFRPLFDRVFARYLAAAPGAREDLAADFVRLGIRSIPLLIMRLEDADLRARAAALEALRLTTGTANGYDPAAPDASCWEAWWIARKDRLVADAPSGLFVEPVR